MGTDLSLQFEPENYSLTTPVAMAIALTTVGDLDKLNKYTSRDV
jgi:hypothetical protein